MQVGRDVWIRNRPVEHTRGDPGVSPQPPAVDDGDMAARILAAYRLSGEGFQTDQSFWTDTFYELRKAEIDVLERGDAAELAAMLRDPAANLLHYGFDEICDPARAPMHGTSMVVSTAEWLYDLLRRCAEAVGVSPLEYPELLPEFPDTPPPVEGMLDQLSTAMGFDIAFPNPYPGERGLRTSRGVMGFRAIQSLHQALRLRELCGDLSTVSVLEIGGGLGRTAYYAHRMGCRDYTIIDIPLTAAPQAYFLMRTLGADAVALAGESLDASVKLLPPKAYLTSAARHDLVLNVDSLTEMTEAVGREYWSKIKASADIFLSINHERNYYSFRDLYVAEPNLKVVRTPYWLRRGYVDEVVDFRAQASTPTAR